MNEKAETFIHNKYTLLAFVVFCCILLGVFLYGLRTGRGGTVENAVQRIEQSTAEAGKHINNAKAEISNAEAAIDRADEAIKSSRESAKEMQAGVDECQQLVDQCLEANRSAQGILKGTRTGNRE